MGEGEDGGAGEGEGCEVAARVPQAQALNPELPRYEDRYLFMTPVT